MNWLLVVLILAYPGLRVDYHWYDELARAEVVGHYAPLPEDPERIGWFDKGTGAIHVLYVWDDGEMVRRLSHETMHYLAAETKLGDWDRFAKLGWKVIKSGGYTEHQVASVKGMIAYGGGEELHAELPRILEGEIPCEFAPWYPWFELGCEKVKAGDEGSGGRAGQEGHALSEGKRFGIRAALR